MKKIIILTLITISIIIIYNLFKDNKIYYVSINDKLCLASDLSYDYDDYIEDYLEEKGLLENYVDIYNEDNRIIDIIRNINDNILYNDKSIQNILIKADLLTISLGYNDIISKIPIYNMYELYQYIDSYLNDLDNLYKVLRKYDKEKIIMLGYYNMYDSKYDKLFDYLNDKVSNMCSKYNIIFVDISDISNDNNKLSIEKEHYIFDKIRVLIDSK